MYIPLFKVALPLKPQLRCKLNDKPSQLSECHKTFQHNSLFVDLLHYLATQSSGSEFLTHTQRVACVHDLYIECWSH
jgi:hypothetical protein